MSETSTISQPEESVEETHKLGSVLRRIVDQIDDAEKTNSETLHEMQDRLTALSKQTSHVKLSYAETDNDTIQHIESKIEGLSDRIEIISQGRVLSVDDLEERIEALANRVAEDEDVDSKQVTPEPIQESDKEKDNTDEENDEKLTSLEEADITFTVTNELEVEARSEVESENETEKACDVSEKDLEKSEIEPEEKSEDGDVAIDERVELAKKIDHKIVAPDIAPINQTVHEELATIVEHLSPIVETSEHLGTKKSSKNTTVSSTKLTSPKVEKIKKEVNLEQRFAQIAEKLEETFKVRERELQERVDISNKFDELAAKFEGWLQSNDKKPSLDTIEKRIDSLADYVRKVESQAARIDILENQIVRLIELVENNSSETSVRKDLDQSFEEIASRIMEEKSLKIADMVVSKVGETVESSGHKRLEAIQQSITDLNSGLTKQDKNASNSFAVFNDTLETMSGRLDTLEENMSLHHTNDMVSTDGDSIRSVIDAPPSDTLNPYENHHHVSTDQYSFSKTSLDTEFLDSNEQGESHKVVKKLDSSNSQDDYISAARQAANAAMEKKRKEDIERYQNKKSSKLFAAISGFKNKLPGFKKKDIGESKKASGTLISAIIVLLLCISMFLSSFWGQKGSLPKKEAKYNKPYQLNLPSNKTAHTATPRHTKSESRLENGDVSEQIKSNAIVEDNKKTQVSSNQTAKKTTELGNKKDLQLKNINNQILENKSIVTHEENKPKAFLSAIHKVKANTPSNRDTAFGISVKPNAAQYQETNESNNIPNSLPESSFSQFSSYTNLERAQGFEPTKNKTIDHYRVNRSKKLKLPPEQIGSLPLRMAAAKGNHKAQFAVAMRYIEGHEIKRSYRMAVKWLKKAAIQGFPPAQYHLAAFYEQGYGVSKDISKAKTWYMRAANNGNIKAMHNLAVLYLQRPGYKPNHQEAAKWFLKAADRGLADSQYNLGVLYKNGLGVKRNTQESYKWFALAEKGGDAQASGQLANLENTLDMKDLFLGKAAYDKWRPLPVDKNANLSDQIKSVFIGSMANHQKDPLTVQTQRLLNKLGYKIGNVDGYLGPKTREAIRAFQLKKGMEITGEVSKELIAKLSEQV